MRETKNKRKPDINEMRHTVCNLKSPKDTTGNWRKPPHPTPPPPRPSPFTATHVVPAPTPPPPRGSPGAVPPPPPPPAGPAQATLPPCSYPDAPIFPFPLSRDAVALALAPDPRSSLQAGGLRWHSHRPVSLPFSGSPVPSLRAGDLRSHPCRIALGRPHLLSRLRLEQEVSAAAHAAQRHSLQIVCRCVCLSTPASYQSAAAVFKQRKHRLILYTVTYSSLDPVGGNICIDYQKLLQEKLAIVDFVALMKKRSPLDSGFRCDHDAHGIAGKYNATTVPFGVFKEDDLLESNCIVQPARGVSAGAHVSAGAITARARPHPRTPPSPPPAVFLRRPPARPRPPHAGALLPFPARALPSPPPPRGSPPFFAPWRVHICRRSDPTPTVRHRACTPTTANGLRRARSSSSQLAPSLLRRRRRRRTRFHAGSDPTPRGSPIRRRDSSSSPDCRTPPATLHCDLKASNGGCIPFTDVSNTAHRDDKERKRERERERYAAMTVEQKTERNKKLREARQCKKFDATHSGPSKDELAALDKEDVVPNDNVDWLHRNDSCQHHHSGNKDKLMPFPAADNNSAIDFTKHKNCAPIPGVIHDYHPDWSTEQATSTLHPITGEANGDGDTPASIVDHPSIAAQDDKECKRERERARYAGLTVEQKNGRNKKLREARQRRKFEATHSQPSKAARRQHRRQQRRPNRGAQQRPLLQPLVPHRPHARWQPPLRRLLQPGQRYSIQHLDKLKLSEINTAIPTIGDHLNANLNIV